MENKTILAILVIIIILLIIGFVGYTFFTNQNEKIKIDNVDFNLPEGYHQTKSLNNDDEINITNGFNTMLLSKCDANNARKNVYDYKDYKLKENLSVRVSNFTVNNITIYKAVVVNHTNTIHYWFDYGNKTYTIYTWNGNENNDKVVSELVK